MRKLLSFLLGGTSLLLGLPCASLAQAPTKQWDRTLGGTNTDALRSLQQTSDGGYILGGYSDSGLNGDKTQASRGADDYWVVKLDAAGTKQWDKTLGTVVFDQLYALRQTRDGGYLLGGYSAYGVGGDKTQPSKGGNTDFWLIKLDAQGTKLWDVGLGGPGSETVYALQQTSDGGYLVGGSSTSGIGGDKSQASQGGSDYWVVKLDASGAKQWDRTVGGSNTDILLALQQTADGGYMLGGSSASGSSGDKTEPNKGLEDYWVVKLDANGSKLWDKTLGTSSNDEFTCLQQTADGGYVVGGYTAAGMEGDKTQASQGGSDFWLIKLDTNGVKRWDRSLGGSGSDALSALQQTLDGGYILGGSSSSGVSGDKTQASRGLNDYWLLKVDAAGIRQWDLTVGGSGGESLFALQQTAEGGYILGGISNSDISGDKTQPRQGNSGTVDYWVVKLWATPLATAKATPVAALRASPNPTTSSFTLHGPAGAPYQLLNQLGQVVRRGRVSAEPLDVQDLPAGLYLLRDELSGLTTKLVKE